MVKLTEVEDEHFVEKPSTTGDGALFAEDDDDYTDTDSSLSDEDFPAHGSGSDSETLTDRILALRDMVSPSTRAKISSFSSTLYQTTSSGITWGGKGLWAVCTTVLLLGMPYALAIGAEQEMMEEERQRGLMAESASGMIQPGATGDEGRAAL